MRIEEAWLRRGAVARALFPLSLLYGAVAARRARSVSPVRLPVPVVVVGNLVAGGAGKTPTVIAVVAALRDAGWRPGVISRGYRSTAARGDAPRAVRVDGTATEFGDEPLLIARRTGAPVVVSPDRVAAGRALLAAHPGVDVIVADDGLQHHRLARDAQVIVFDERGAGNGWLLPAGPLREPLPAAVPPRTLVLYNAPAPTTALPGACAERRLGGVTPLAAWAEGRPSPGDGWAALAGRPLLAVAGTARPGRFFDMLRAKGLAIAEAPQPDHADYTALPWPPGTADVVVTEKDAVKLDPARIGTTRVWVATLDFTLPPGFTAALLALLPPRP